MRTPNRILPTSSGALLVLGLLALAPHGARAQCEPSGGPLMGAPFYFGVRPGSAVLASSPDRLSYKDHGFQTSTPPAWPARPGTPDFGRLLSCATTRGIHIDAMSLGQDIVLADAAGRVAVPAGQWGALTLSVAAGTVGAPGSVIRQDSMAGPTGAHVYSYCLPGSTLPPELEGHTQRAHRSSEVGLGAPSAQEDIDVLDHVVPIYLGDAPVANLLPDFPTVFFSVSAASLPAVPRSWFGGTPPSAATILQTTWSPRQRTWNCPTPFKTFRELSLPQSADIDALAIDYESASLQRVLFSLTQATSGGRDQLLFALCASPFQPVLPVTYTTQGGTPVSSDAGLLGGEEVDAVCALDPPLLRRPGGLNAQYFWFGNPVANYFRPPTPGVAASAIRVLDGGGTDAYRTWVVGYPPNGATSGLAVLNLGLPNLPSLALPVAALPRSASPTHCGDPMEVTIPVPASVQLTFTGVELRWYVADQPVTSFAEATPLVVRL